MVLELILLLLFLLFFLPFISYLMSKMITMGVLRARQLFEIEKISDQRRDLDQK